MSSGRGFETDCPIDLTASVSPVIAAFIAELTSQHLNFLSRCHRHSMSQYHNTRNKSISQFQEYRLRYHASVEDDTKRVQSALCTRMRIVFSLIRLWPKTSECEKKVIVVSTATGCDVTNCATTSHGFNKQDQNLQCFSRNRRNASAIGSKPSLIFKIPVCRLSQSLQLPPLLR